MASGKVVVAAGFVIFRRIEAEIQYLLLQTSYGEHHWTPPKVTCMTWLHFVSPGHVDPGESEFETALRETEEESGLTADKLKIYKDFEKILHYEVRGKPKKFLQVTLSHEHIKYEWLKLGDALKYVMKYPDFQEVLNDADKYIHKQIPVGDHKS
ncbi:hypothetical protein KUTeg_017429 [Tegillarca granosa]|uniref:Bis(5'-nucleosyl)-tetraphosphatase [asymmetrical] n=1 Tax=Tegillarca granosa TaxID=220873 RepID=A0ABQ9EES7_TEGGR|nr:hypothetical protein KUTeg_017429 [Tegillarca granosa]